MKSRDSPLLVLERIAEFLRYDPETGQFFWKKSSGKAVTGSVAGTLKDGYIQIRLCGIRYYAHILVWLLHYGEWPVNKIDHRDRNRSNNRFGNLRDVTQLVNVSNSSRGLGIFFDPNCKTKPWRFKVIRNAKVVHRSAHTTLEQALEKSKVVYANLTLQEA